MPITSNVAWDGRLEAYKGRDTTHYVATLAATAKTCAACRLPLPPEGPLSLTVDITEGAGPDGTQYLTFDSFICHRDCIGPGLVLRPGTGMPEELHTLGARITLDDRDASGVRTVPVLAYTLFPSLSVREPGGELTSVLVSILLSQGFQLSMSADYGHILQHATDVKDSFSCTIREQGLIRLHLDAEVMYSQQLDPQDPDDAEWLEAARAGSVLVISGDNLDITGTGPGLDAAARLGTLVTGKVSVRT